MPVLCPSNKFTFLFVDYWIYFAARFQFVGTTALACADVKTWQTVLKHLIGRRLHYSNFCTTPDSCSVMEIRRQEGRGRWNDLDPYPTAWTVPAQQQKPWQLVASAICQGCSGISSHPQGYQLTHFCILETILMSFSVNLTHLKQFSTNHDWHQDNKRNQLTNQFRFMMETGGILACLLTITYPSY